MRKTWRWSVLVALAALLGAAGARASIGPIQVLVAGTAFDSTGLKQASVSCPPGTIAFSGGAGRNGGLATTPIVLHQSLPQGNPPTGWVGVAGEQAPTADSWGVLVWALCATVSGYQLVESVSPLDSSADKAITATCPPGKVPIGGGGGVTPSSPSLALYGLRPFDGGWQATAREVTGLIGSWQLDVKVSCAPGVEIERFEAFTPNGSDSRDGFDLYCPAGWTALAGGVWLAGSSTAADLTSVRYNMMGPFGWSVGGRRVAGSTSWVLNGAILCRPPLASTSGFGPEGAEPWSAP